MEEERGEERIGREEMRERERERGFEKEGEGEGQIRREGKKKRRVWRKKEKGRNG